MKNNNITKMDSKGRMLIPVHIRKFLSANNGTELILVPDEERGELRVLPLIKEKSARIRFVLEDYPGSLAHVADVLAANKINILMSRSNTLIKGKLAEWDVIIDTSQFNNGFKYLKEKLLETEGIKKVEMIG